MIQQRHRFSAAVYLAVDGIATLAAFASAWLLRFEFPIVPLTKDVPDIERYIQLLPLVVILWPIVFYFHGLYQVRRGRSRVDEAFSLFLAVLLASVLLSVALAWYRPQATPGSVEYFTYSRVFLALFGGLDLFLVLVGRNIVRLIMRRLRETGHFLQRILVIGAGDLGKEITAKICAHRELGFEVVGFLDDDPGKANWNFLGVPVIGTTKDVEHILEEKRIDQVFVALPLDAHRKMLRILEVVGQECVEIKLVPDILQYATLNATLEDVDGTPIINLSQVPLQGWSSLIKRSMDMLCAGLGILALLPLLPIVASIIWFQDRGPIFYRQERMGLDGRRFQMLKFRSMRINAESSTGPIWAVRDDPRCTPVGAFMRRWSLDELPQLWNVVRGDMSLVGPRPERPTFVNEFKKKIPQYMLRHRVKAGITGWAQVNGWRGNTSIRKRIEYDLYYIENWSLALDLKILWMTLRHGIRLNAY